MTRYSPVCLLIGEALNLEGLWEYETRFKQDNGFNILTAVPGTH